MSDNTNEIILEVKDLKKSFGDHVVLESINTTVRKGEVIAIIGPSGCGKSTFLKTLNRMNDLVDGVRIDGKVLLDGEDIYEPGVDTTILRKKVGMVFQQPNPFPMSIYDNIAYGPRVHGIRDKKRLDQIVEESLRGAAIFDEVKDRLKNRPWDFQVDSSKESVSQEHLQSSQRYFLWTSLHQHLTLYLQPRLRNSWKI